MFVGEGSVEDVIAWFRGNSRAQWLGFFVAGDQRYNKFLNEILAQSDVLDLISGYHIDLFLFGGGQKINIRGSGRDVTVDAVPLTKLNQGEDWHYPAIQHIGDINRSAVRFKQIAKASTLATSAVAEHLGLEVEDLPSLVLIRSDFDDQTKNPKLVLRTRGQADADFVVEFIRSLRRIMERRDKAANMAIPTEGSIRQSRGTVAKIKIERDAIVKFSVRAERQAESLSALLKARGIEVSAQILAKAVLVAPSAEAGLREMASELVVDQSMLAASLSDAQTTEALQRLDKARIAVVNARSRIEQFSQELPSVDRLESYLALNESILAEFEDLIIKFDRKISFKIATKNVNEFFRLSTSVLEKINKLIHAAVAVKTGGMSLLG